MRNRLKRILNEFEHKKIAVIGDYMVDRYFIGNADRISSEAPVPVVLIEEVKTTLGGAGNVVENLISLGAKVTPYGLIGNDNEGNELLRLLKIENIDYSNMLIYAENPTTVKTRIIANKQQIVRYDIENKIPLSTNIEERIVKQFKKNIYNYDAIILSDYSKGIFSNKLAPQIIKIAKKHNKIVVADPKPCNINKFKGATAITPNLKEASLCINKHIPANNKELINIGEKLLKKIKSENLIITMGANGIILFSENENFIVPTYAKEVIDVTGAGDTVISIYTLAIASGSTQKEAIMLANTAAGIVVGKSGSAKITKEEVLEYYPFLYEKKLNE